jgi:hypothetical protein
MVLAKCIQETTRGPIAGQQQWLQCSLAVLAAVRTPVRLIIISLFGTFSRTGLTRRWASEYRST